MNLLADIARCHGDIDRRHGEPEHPVCARCARKIQIERDKPTALYPYMSAAPINGRCAYRIEEKDDA